MGKAKGKTKEGGKGGKDSQLLIRIASEERAAFIRLCEELDTTAAREIRRFIRDFTARHGRAGCADRSGARSGDGGESRS
jgi:hypothetical protein